VKVTPKGRKVFIVLYRGTGLRLRKYTIGPYGRVTLYQARFPRLKIFAARAEGRDPAAEKQTARRRLIADRVEDLIEVYISERVSKNHSARQISRLLRREVIPNWGSRSVHEIGKREIVELVQQVASLAVSRDRYQKVIHSRPHSFCEILLGPICVDCSSYL